MSLLSTNVNTLEKVEMWKQTDKVQKTKKRVEKYELCGRNWSNPKTSKRGGMSKTLKVTKISERSEEQESSKQNVWAQKVENLNV